jgi:hypothetical protein
VIENGKLFCHNNNWNAWNTDSRGDTTSVRFSKEEFAAARSIKFMQRGRITGLDTPTGLVSGDSRFVRFFYMIDAARGKADVAMKIVYYCSALETLLSSSQSELTHQVAERAALVLDAEAENRINIYKLIKKCYAARSKAVHGASFKMKTFDDLLQLSASIDMYCRILAHKWLSDQEFSNIIEETDEIFETYFLKKIMA